MPFNCVIFDFDGTLADSKECSVLSTQQAFSKLGLSIPSQQQIEYYMGIPIEESFLDMSQDTIDDKKLSDLITIFRNCYKENEQSTLNVFPGIPEVLKVLHDKEIKCFVLSSNQNHQCELVVCSSAESLFYRPRPKRPSEGASSRTTITR